MGITLNDPKARQMEERTNNNDDGAGGSKEDWGQTRIVYKADNGNGGVKEIRFVL